MRLVLAKVPYYFFEVIDYGGEAIHASDYFEVGRASGRAVDVTDFATAPLAPSFSGTGAEKLAQLKDRGRRVQPR